MENEVQSDVSDETLDSEDSYVYHSSGRFSQSQINTAVLLILAVITAVEVTIGVILDGSFLTLTLLVFACAKAAFVIAIFMHAKYEAHPYLVVFVAFGIPALLALPFGVIVING